MDLHMLIDTSSMLVGKPFVPFARGKGNDSSDRQELPPQVPEEGRLAFN